MNNDRVEGNWKQFKGKVQEKWGKLTNDDLDVIDGKRENLAGKLQERYGLAKDDVDRELDDFYRVHEAESADR
ncbi:MAG: CsbD family protein [Gemmatimonadales bacterium]